MLSFGEGSDMSSLIKVEDVYDSHLNFLIGSGASFGLFPTLALKVKDAGGTAQTIETLATHFDQQKDLNRHSLLFMHYYRECIRPVCQFTVQSADGDPAKGGVLKNYRTFIETVVTLLDRRRPLDKRCNVFTTNYDGCFSHMADAILEAGSIDFVLNDGTRGFHRKVVQARNFNSFLCQSGVFDLHHSSVPQINLIHLHGSVYWRKADGNIAVDYQPTGDADIVPAVAGEALTHFSACLASEDKTIADLPTFEFPPHVRAEFWSEYEQLPIVNPTKWKFHETVFEEHYYQMLRLLSYELERPNAVLITFGFSFADEHILNLVRRSLSNPRLQVFVCCFDAAEADRMKAHFKGFRNVQCVTLDEGPLDFAAFNESVFSLREHAGKPSSSAAAPANDAPVVEDHPPVGAAQ
jgi:hypothetical protein